MSDEYVSRADTIGIKMAEGLVRLQELIQLAEMAVQNEDSTETDSALGAMRMKVSELQEFLVRKGIQSGAQRTQAPQVSHD